MISEGQRILYGSVIIGCFSRERESADFTFGVQNVPEAP